MADLTTRLTTIQNTLTAYKGLRDERAEVEAVANRIGNEALKEVADGAVFLSSNDQFQAQRQAVKGAVERIGTYEQEKAEWAKAPATLQEAREALFLFPEKDRDHFALILNDIDEGNLNRGELLQHLRALLARARTEEETTVVDTVWEMSVSAWGKLTGGAGDEHTDLEEGARTPVKGHRSKGMFGVVETEVPTVKPWAENRNDYALRLEAAISRVESTPVAAPVDPGVQPLTDALNTLFRGLPEGDDQS